MIKALVFLKDGKYAGFRVDGHAGFSEEGQDIICSAVSVLSVNAVNSIELLTSAQIESEEKEGHLECHFPEGLTTGGELLMESWILGMRQIAGIKDESEEPYVQLTFQEV